MKTSAISPMPRASVTTTPSTSATHPAALMPVSPSPVQTLAISPMTTITTAIAAATAIQVDLLLMSAGQRLGHHQNLESRLSPIGANIRRAWFDRAVGSEVRSDVV